MLVTKISGDTTRARLVYWLVQPARQLQERTNSAARLVIAVASVAMRLIMRARTRRARLV